MFPHQKSIDEKGQNGLEEEGRLAYVGITRAKDLSFISFSLNEFYQGDWIDSLSSRFVDELPEKFIEKNNNLERDDQDFEFNQDIDNDNEILEAQDGSDIKKIKMISEKLKELKNKFYHHKIDGYVVPKNDEYFLNLQKKIN